jgi:MFS family permease
VQALATVGLLVPAVLAPVVAPQFGFEPRAVGYLQGLVYLAAMLCGVLAGNLADRQSGVKVSQWSLVLVAIGLASFSAAGWLAQQGQWRWISLACLIIGGVFVGCGYGLPNPSAAKILGQHAPTERRGLFFSIKQSGVPAGVALCGFVIPALLVWMHWSQALLVAALGMLATCLWLRGQYKFMDAGVTAKPLPAVSKRLDFSPLAEVFKSKPVRQIALISAVFAGNQACFFVFLVTYLVAEHHMSLAAAAGILAMSQIASVVFRPVWGQVADLSGNPLRVIALLGIAMGLALLLLAWGPGWQLPLLPLSIGVAATAVAWNGVYYAQLTRVVPTQQLASMTGGSQFLTFFGAMTAPVMFGWVVGWTGSYPVAFSVLAMTGLLSGSWTLYGLWRTKERPVTNLS